MRPVMAAATSRGSMWNPASARKGTSTYETEVAGLAAHAGLEPEKGVNALVELAHQVLALESIARPELGTTVTATVAAAGTTQNTVPAAIPTPTRMGRPARLWPAATRTRSTAQAIARVSSSPVRSG